MDLGVGSSVPNTLFLLLIFSFPHFTKKDATEQKAPKEPESHLPGRKGNISPRGGSVLKLLLSPRAKAGAFSLAPSWDPHKPVL